MTDKDEKDDQRYIEYFQRHLLREGSDEFIRAQATRLDSEREILVARHKDLLESENSSLENLQRDALTYQGKSYLDCFFSERIFNPLIEKTLSICKEAGIEQKLPVRFANSPSLDISPAALPSTATHILFAGHGTSTFCNYWSKIFSESLFEASSLTLSTGKWDPIAYSDKIKGTSITTTATSLAIFYSLNETLLGYGKLEQEEKFLLNRTLLLNAMKVFVIGHEIAHFSYHEDHPDTCGIRPGNSNKDLEMECDGIGLAICTVYGLNEANTFTTNFIGPLMLLYAISLCEKIKTIITGKTAKPSETHPATLDRIKNIFLFAESINMHSEILQIMRDSLDAAMIIGSQVELTAREIVRGASGNPKH